MEGSAGALEGWSAGGRVSGGNMSNEARVQLLTSYCSYTLGQCVLPEGSPECRQRNPVACRNCRQKNEKDEVPNGERR